MFCIDFKCISLNDVSVIDLFIENRNYSFKVRSNDRIPYQPLSKDRLLSRMARDKGSVYGCFEKERLVGGVCCFRSDKDGIKTWRINHVWVHPEYQGAGIGSEMLRIIEAEAKNEAIQMLELNVSNIYKPALNLYKKLGFRSVMIYANEPKTFFFIRLIKSISPYKYSELQRVCRLVYSTCVFCLLYRQDSTPRGLTKIIYEKIKK